MLIRIRLSMQIQHLRGSLLITLAAIVALVCVVIPSILWTYSEYEAWRAASIFDACTSIHIGDSEASILPMVHRFSGIRWNPQIDLGSREEHTDPAEYDRRLKALPDHNYSLVVNPWEMPMSFDAGKRTWMQSLLWPILAHVPTGIRAASGMRNWIYSFDMSIRQGRVVRIFSGTFFEAHRGWLAHEWQLSSDHRSDHGPPSDMSVEGGFLTMTGGGPGSVVESYLKPGASPEAYHAARAFNLSCLTSLGGCRNFCDSSAELMNYLHHHPEIEPGFDLPKCK